MIDGIIIKGVGGLYSVKTEFGLYTCAARGKFRVDEQTPLVGDYVIIDIIDEFLKKGYLNEIKPRKNSVLRPKAANIDLVIAVFSAAAPEVSLGVIDNILVCCEWQIDDCEIVVCVNKSDIAETGKIDEVKRVYRGVYDVIAVSAKTGTNIDVLRGYLKNKTAMLAGPSGVGKSSLLNALIPGAGMETGKLSAKTEKGKHTTRHAELFGLGDDKTFIADTPGFSAVSADIVPKDKLELCFAEFEPFLGKCKFSKCIHIKEEGCAVKAAVGAGIAKERYERYCLLR
jgi:ribosome biogenesis GTPase